LIQLTEEGTFFRLSPARSFALIRTCHRIELVFLLPLSDSSDLFPLEDGGRWYEFKNADALEHLLSVASGLDSAVPFEPQIADQVENAEVYGEGQYATILKELLKTSSDIGRRIRTVIGTPYRSLGTITGDLVADVLDYGSKVLMIGSGAMARDVTSSLNSSGKEFKLYVMTRRQRLDWHLERVVKVSADDIEDLKIDGFDAVISATRERLAGRLLEKIFNRSQPKLIIDLSFPRSLDPDFVCGRCERYMNVDDVAIIAEREFDVPARELSLARSMIKGAVKALLEELERKTSSEESLRDLRIKAAKVLEDESEIALKMMEKGLGAEVVIRKAMERFANRMLNDLTERLRSVSDGHHIPVAAMATKLSDTRSGCERS
jgi:glutamyl-tRNA reductase